MTLITCLNISSRTWTEILYIFFICLCDIMGVLQKAPSNLLLISSPSFCKVQLPGSEGKEWILTAVLVCWCMWCLSGIGEKELSYIFISSPAGLLIMWAWLTDMDPLWDSRIVSHALIFRDSLWLVSRLKGQLLHFQHINHRTILRLWWLPFALWEWVYSVSSEWIILCQQRSLSCTLDAV